MRSTLTTGRKGRKGFTLIELLVVIAMIAILAAILFPVFTQARKKAMQAKCLFNVKQMGMAFVMYAADNDGKFPLAVGSDLSSWPWKEGTWKYITDRRIWTCPSNGYFATGGIYCDYAYNENLSGKRVDFAHNVARIIVLADTRGAPVMYYNRDYNRFPGIYPYYVAPPYTPAGIHGGTQCGAPNTTDSLMDGIANCVFGDGHAEARIAGELSQHGWDPVSDEMKRLWQPMLYSSPWEG